MCPKAIEVRNVLEFLQGYIAFSIRAFAEGDLTEKYKQTNIFFQRGRIYELLLQSSALPFSITIHAVFKRAASSTQNVQP